jgi:hypothetical protein
MFAQHLPVVDQCYRWRKAGLSEEDKSLKHMGRLSFPE